MSDESQLTAHRSEQSGSASGPSVDFFFPKERDVPGWEARHRDGLVPGRWPYGLDGLADFAGRFRAIDVAEPGRSAIARDRVSLALRRSTRPAEGTLRENRPIGLAWEENTARRMLITAPRPEMYAGVIWVTDVIARGGNIGSMRNVLRRMNGLWVISSGQLEAVRELVGTDGPPVGFFRFGVDEAFYASKPYPERPLVFSVGGDRDRDTSTLFAALDRVHRLSPETEIIVQTSSALAPPDGVSTIAHVSHLELRALYERASVVVIATRQNLHTSGMTVSLEAMATGRPVVMTETAGIRDYITDGVTGSLVGVGDDAALASEVLTLLADPVRAESYGVAGRRAVERNMTTRQMVAELAAFAKLTASSR